jgi:hypothetical protein
MGNVATFIARSQSSAGQSEEFLRSFVTRVAISYYGRFGLGKRSQNH